MSGKETMIKRIDTERGDTPAEEVVELNLDNCKSNGEPEGLDSYTSLSKLSLINVGFTSLKNFPKLPELCTLELSDNRIAGSLSCLKHCQKLTSLNLSGNHIKTIDALEPLADLTNLESLDLYNCEVTKTDEFRDSVFKLIPDLKYLDGYDRDMNEKAESDDDEDEDENGKEVGDEEEENNGEASKEGTNGAAADDDDEEEDDFDSGDDDEEVESGSEEEEEIGLEYLIKGDAPDEDDEDDGDYEGAEEEEDDVEIPEEEEDDVNTSGSRGVKRKHEDGDDDEDDNE